MRGATTFAPTRVLLIGPLPIEGDVIGGTKVSFAGLVTALSREPGLAVTVHDTSRRRAGRGRLGRLWLDVAGMARLAARLLRPSERFDAVLFNTSSGALLTSGPIVAALCKLRRTPLTVRVFGGDLDLFHARAPRPLRWLVDRTVLRAERVLLQTHALCEAFASRANVAWWPTTRDLAPVARTPHAGGTRFLFLAQLRREKGVAEAVAAAARLPGTATLTVHGPPMPGFGVGSLPPHDRWTYGGAVPSEDVPRVLAAHDVLVFPTYHDGEGLPGIVIEAMQAGLPVITTRFRALGELVRDGVDGLLVAPRDTEALAAAMRALATDGERLAQLARGAVASGEEFRTSRWTATLSGWLGAPDAAWTQHAPGTDEASAPGPGSVSASCPSLAVAAPPAAPEVAARQGSAPARAPRRPAAPTGR